jgi:hypothetical protein
MALDLSLSYSQSNNATTLTITDSSGTYNNPDNLTGWGDPNPRASFAFSDIVISTDVATYSPVKYHLILTVTVTDKAGTETTYDTINLYDHRGSAFTAVADLTWDLDAADFVSSGTAMGLATDKLTDGQYEISYQLVQNDDHSTVIDEVSETILIDGDVRYDVYNKLRQIPVDYDNENNDKSRDIMEALTAYSYLIGMEASASVSMQEEITSMLYTLDKLVSDGSHYTW